MKIIKDVKEKFKKIIKKEIEVASSSPFKIDQEVISKMKAAEEAIVGFLLKEDMSKKQIICIVNSILFNVLLVMDKETQEDFMNSWASAFYAAKEIYEEREAKSNQEEANNAVKH